jgi:hypothetical protein
MVGTLAKRPSTVDASTRQTHLRVGYALSGVAIAVAILGGNAFPHGVQWVIAAVLLWPA